MQPVTLTHKLTNQNLLQDWRSPGGLPLSLQVPGTLGTLDFSACLAKAKNHTTYNQFWKWHRNSIEKPWSQRYESPSSGGTCTIRAVQAPVQPKEVRLKVSQGVNHKLNRLAYTAHPSLGHVLMCASPRVSGSASKVQEQGSNRGPGCGSSSSSGPQICPGPTKTLEQRPLSSRASVRTEGRV